MVLDVLPPNKSKDLKEVSLSQVSVVRSANLKYAVITWQAQPPLPQLGKLWIQAPFLNQKQNELAFLQVCSKIPPV